MSSDLRKRPGNMPVHIFSFQRGERLFFGIRRIQNRAIKIKGVGDPLDKIAGILRGRLRVLAAHPFKQRMQILIQRVRGLIALLRRKGQAGSQYAQAFLNGVQRIPRQLFRKGVSVNTEFCRIAQLPAVQNRPEQQPIEHGGAEWRGRISGAEKPSEKAARFS